MGSERRRRRLAAAALLGAAMLCAGPVPGAAAAEAWWVPVGLRGQAVVSVTPGSEGVLALTAGVPVCLALPGSGRPARCDRVLGHPGTAGFALSGGRVLQGGAVDPGSPNLGATARLIAQPAALPGVVVAVAADGTVWRRSHAGAWDRSLLLLPQNLFSGPPAITAMVAFEHSPATPTVYLGTDGFAVLISTDGGDDWERAAPGLPTGVLALATDEAARAVYAGTRDGVWVHHLQAVPTPPAYAVSGLRDRWLGIAALTAVAISAALAVLVLMSGGRPGGEPRKQRNDRKL